MKLKMQWLATVATVASSSMAMAFPLGYGDTYRTGAYGSCDVCPAPVAERVTVEKKIIIRRTAAYAPASWDAPYDSPGRIIGDAVAAPFRLVGGTLMWTGRALSPARLAPVGERVTMTRVIHRRTMMEPVGERVTTVTTKTIRRTPCGKRMMIKRETYHRKMLMPVSERVIIKKTFMRPACDF